MNRIGDIKWDYILGLILALFVAIVIFGFLFAPTAFGQDLRRNVKNIIGFGSQGEEFEGKEIFRYNLYTKDFEYFNGNQAFFIREGDYVIVNGKRVNQEESLKFEEYFFDLNRRGSNKIAYKTHELSNISIIFVNIEKTNAVKLDNEDFLLDVLEIFAEEKYMPVRGDVVIWLERNNALFDNKIVRDRYVFRMDGSLWKENREKEFKRIKEMSDVEKSIILEAKKWRDNVAESIEIVYFDEEGKEVEKNYQTEVIDYFLVVDLEKTR